MSCHNQSSCATAGTAQLLNADTEIRDVIRGAGRDAQFPSNVCSLAEYAVRSLRVAKPESILCSRSMPRHHGLIFQLDAADRGRDALSASATWRPDPSRGLTLIGMRSNSVYLSVRLLQLARRTLSQLPQANTALRNYLPCPIRPKGAFVKCFVRFGLGIGANRDTSHTSAGAAARGQACAGVVILAHTPVALVVTG